METSNLFNDTATPEEGERFDTILNHKNLLIERIISSAAITPHEYIQAQDEWVLLMRGKADLRVEGKLHALKEGDHIFLPAGVPHKVERASDGAMWLAVHLHPEQCEDR